MARYSKTVIPLRGSGAIKATLEAYGGMLAMYRDAARNAIVRDSMWQGGEYYRLTFVPLKFTNYAKRLGYHVTEAWAKRKAKFAGTMPLVFTDALTGNGLRGQVLRNSRTEARVTRSNCYAIIRMPGPAYMNATAAVYGTLRSVLPEEISRCAAVIAEALAANLEGTESRRGGAAPLRRLTNAQGEIFARSTPANKSRKAPGAGRGRAA